MRTDADHRPLPPAPDPVGARATPAEAVDLDSPAAVQRAIALHRAGKAVFAVPFGSPGQGSLTWLDPRAKEAGR